MACADATVSESTTIIRLDEGNSEPTVTSILTSLFDNAATEGAKSFDSQTVASAQAISFSTVLTNAYFTGEAETLACTGSVDVETVSTDAPVGFATLNLYCNDFAIGYNNYVSTKTCFLYRAILIFYGYFDIFFHSFIILSTHILFFVLVLLLARKYW